MASASEERVFLCLECKKVFQCQLTALKHMREEHKMQIPKPTKNDSLDKPFPCNLCEKRLKKKSSLYRHLRQIHKEFSHDKRRGLKCPEPTCDVSFFKREQLCNHIESCHGVTIEFSRYSFPTFSDFKAWKEKYEKETRSFYVTSHKQQKSIKIRGKEKKLSYYICHRSGTFTSTGTGKRKPKSAETIKINGFCSSAINCITTEKGVKVRHWKTHFGHTCELDQIPLTKQERVQIANKLKDGVTYEEILDEVHDSLLTSDIRRIHLLTRKDLYNISRSFNIPNEEHFLEKEPPDINEWVDNMRELGNDCPIIFYKEKGIKYLQLREPELFLVLMTKLQQQMVSNWDNSVVCLDCIFHIQTFNFYVITLIVLDACNNGCPLAFCITNRINERTIYMFYDCLKEKVGTISASLFMSIDKPVFYSQWQIVMGPTKHQLLCTWDISKSWKRKIEKLSVSVETKVKLYKNLLLIMQEKQCGEFHSMLEQTLSEVEKDDNLKGFASDFRGKYLETYELWAYCYRSNFIVNSSLILDKMHRTLQHCYMRGKRMSSIVRVLELLLKVSRDQILEKIKKTPKELQPEIIENGVNIVNEEVDLVKTKDATEKLSQGSITEADSTYVKHNAERICPPDCKPFCSVCCICFHKFTCTCTDNSLNWNICEHIRATVHMLEDRCNHGKGENCEIVQNGEAAIFQNVAEEVIVEMAEGNEMDTNEVDSDTNDDVDPIMESESEEKATNTKEIDSENFQLLLLQKIECFHHMVKNESCKPKQYAKINEYFDKIFELFVDEQ